MIGRNINFLYEFETPLGYLPMGYQHKNIPLTFQDINEKQFEFTHPLIYFGYADNKTKFRKLSESSDIFYVYENDNVKQKIITELTDDEIQNDYNLFAITATHEQNILQKILSDDTTNYLTQTSKKYLRDNRNFKIVFIDDKEGGFNYPPSFFDKMYQLYDDIGLEPNQLVFLTNTANINEIYNLYLKLRKRDSFMICDASHFFIYDAGKCLVDYLSKVTEKNNLVSYDSVYYSVPMLDEIDDKRNKYFLSMNRNSERIHRTYLVNDLIKNDLFDKGYISLFKSDRVEYLGTVDTEIKTNIVDKYPFTIDYDDKNFIAGLHNYFNSSESWLNSYFSIVSETSVESGHLFITEKCIRPMIYFHPFIILGNPNTLKELRKLGFETFPEFFDESYDTIPNEQKRREFIVKEIKKVCDMSLNDVHSLYQSVKPKLIHNKNHLVSIFKDKIKYKVLLDAISK